MHISPTYFMLAMMAVFALSGCSKNAAPIAAKPPVPEALAVSVDNSNTGLAISTATLIQCASGGSVITLFKDSNSNGTFDSNEMFVSSTAVCNGAAGAPGAPGTGAGIFLSNAPSASCPAGGTLVTTFQDSNNNGTLDALESITSTSTICNGIAGVTGSSAFITRSIATSIQCPAGGVVYSSHVDGAASQMNVICNGTNGHDGNNTALSLGPVGSIVKSQSFSACHHDYLYIPDSQSSERGWLIFRHQLNGSADQGIGTTGFNVWNVDISDFYLVSEQNNEVYCQLHWEPTKKILSYTVISKLDGLAGEKGEINVNQ
ncbi:MAG: hypothetical protein H7333_06855 [Bdellovibrionales bacterium]|nr:hypothetical protein [Oligoflexia bacterium]